MPKDFGTNKNIGGNKLHLDFNSSNSLLAPLSACRCLCRFPKTGLKESSKLRKRPSGLGRQVPRLRKKLLAVVWKDFQMGHALRQVDDRLL